MSVPGKNPHKDPWASCGDCRFWKRRRSDDVKGSCLRYAPSPVHTEQEVEHPLARWPLTHATDICGDYEVDP